MSTTPPKARFVCRVCGGDHPQSKCGPPRGYRDGSRLTREYVPKALVVPPPTRAGDSHKASQGSRNPVGAGVALLGAVLVLVGALLPIHSYGSLPVPNNSFVSDGDWWMLVVALAMGVGAVYVLTGSALRIWGIAVASVVSLGVGVYGQTTKFQTLPLNAAGQQLFGVSSVKASAGIGVYLVLADGIIGLAGVGLMSGRWRPAGVAPYQRRSTKRCPDCAESVLAEANVCKHCGRRF